MTFKDELLFSILFKIRLYLAPKCNITMQQCSQLDDQCYAEK